MTTGSNVVDQLFFFRGTVQLLAPRANAATARRRKGVFMTRLA